MNLPSHGRTHAERSFLEYPESIIDRVQPKMYPTLSFSGMYRKSFIYRRERTKNQ